ncbi:MAG: hypothetical protein P1P85_03060 [Patescibacteria group bacterium]|nr:hypothetical protein [Patescibacteria group bacterium]
MVEIFFDNNFVRAECEPKKKVIQYDFKVKRREKGKEMNEEEKRMKKG